MSTTTNCRDANTHIEYNYNNNIIISIEGNIGSGKSTFLENIKSKFTNNKNIIFLKEPVDEWEKIRDENNTTMLELFYKDPNKHAFAFQMMAYISRLAVIKDALQNNKNSIIITERSLFTDKMVFAKLLYESKNISLENYSIYLTWFDTFANYFKITTIVYIQASPTTCHDRIGKRSRTGESDISLDYLSKCHEYHNDMVNSDNFKKTNKIVFEADNDIYVNSSILDEWIDRIDKHIALLTHNRVEQPDEMKNILMSTC